MFSMCARLLRSMIRIATDWPPVINAEDWRFIVMSDCGTGWYPGRR